MIILLQSYPPAVDSAPAYHRKGTTAASQGHHTGAASGAGAALPDTRAGASDLVFSCSPQT